MCYYLGKTKQACEARKRALAAQDAKDKWLAEPEQDEPDPDQDEAPDPADIRSAA